MPKRNHQMCPFPVHYHLLNLTGEPFLVFWYCHEHGDIDMRLAIFLSGFLQNQDPDKQQTPEGNQRAWSARSLLLDGDGSYCEYRMGDGLLQDSQSEIIASAHLCIQLSSLLL